MPDEKPAGDQSNESAGGGTCPPDRQAGVPTSRKIDPADSAAQRTEETHRRKLFARAQERFAAGDFDGARDALQAIPAPARTIDAERLLSLAESRRQEVAELRRDIESAVRHNRWKTLSPLLQRLLELQPGDEQANALRHELETREARTGAGSSGRSAEPIDVVAFLDDDATAPLPPDVLPKNVPEWESQRRSPGAAVERPPEPLDAQGDEWEEWVEAPRRSFSPALPSRSAPAPHRRTGGERLGAEGFSSSAVWTGIVLGGLVIAAAIVATVLAILSALR